MDIRVGDLLIVTAGIILFCCLLFMVVLYLKEKMSKDRFFRFLVIFGIGLTCSLIPLGPFGLVFGFPAVLLNSLLISILLDKEKLVD